ncbi:MAG: class I SAM-dependent RNA methyltransferase [Beijerinckiaceae bacterium]
MKSRTPPARSGVAFGVRLAVERLGARGEGVAVYKGRQVYVPHALPGEEILADVDVDRAAVTEILRASPQRIEPICSYYGVCGGCAIQDLEAKAYEAWKRGLVEGALARAGVEAQVEPVIPAHGGGRRRVTLHARANRERPTGGSVVSGFMRARSHDIVDIDTCPVLSPGLASAPRIARSIAQTMAELNKPLDILLTETKSGIDADVRGAGALPAAMRLTLTELAGALDLARLSNHGDIVIERRTPLLQAGRAELNPPPGAFLQATVAGEETLAGLVCEAAKGAARIADLFAGAGTFALRLAEIAPVVAVEHDRAALAALDRAARFAAGLKGVATEERDLFRRPFAVTELAQFDCLVFDPPRAGAEAQASALAQSGVPRVIAVSCNAQTFARDAKILTGGGYSLEQVTPVDQFLYSPHVEIVGVFVRSAPKKKRRPLLG